MRPLFWNVLPDVDVSKLLLAGDVSHTTLALATTKSVFVVPTWPKFDHKWGDIRVPTTATPRAIQT